jgi:alpha-mannosidase
MKYSIRGNLAMADGAHVVSLLNDYILWRLITNQSVDEEGAERFTFEVWLNTVEDKNSLFESLKPFVDEYGEVIDWHECTHDEAVTKPCVIADEYRG